MHGIPSLTDVIFGLVGWLPTLSWMTVAVLLCFVHARGQPKRATLTGIAVAIMVVSSVASSFLFPHLHQVLQDMVDRPQTAISLTMLINGVPHLFAMLLFLWAIFYGDARQETIDED